MRGRGSSWLGDQSAQLLCNIVEILSLRRDSKMSYIAAAVVPLILLACSLQFQSCPTVSAYTLHKPNAGMHFIYSMISI